MNKLPEILERAKWFKDDLKEWFEGVFLRRTFRTMLVDVLLSNNPAEIVLNKDTVPELIIIRDSLYNKLAWDDWIDFANKDNQFVWDYAIYFLLKIFLFQGKIRRVKAVQILEEELRKHDISLPVNTLDRIVDDFMKLISSDQAWLSYSDF